MAPETGFGAIVGPAGRSVDEVAAGRSKDRTGASSESSAPATKVQYCGAASRGRHCPPGGTQKCNRYRNLRLPGM